MFDLYPVPHNGPMQRKRWPLILAHACACWNWKCALLSASARSLVYLAALARSGSHSRLGLVAVEMVYVILTAGIYAGMQQRARPEPAVARQSCDRRRHSWTSPTPRLAHPSCRWTRGTFQSHPRSLPLHADLSALPPACHAPWRLSHRSCRPHPRRRFPPFAKTHSWFRSASHRASLKPWQSPRAPSPIRGRVVTLASHSR